MRKSEVETKRRNWHWTHLISFAAVPYLDRRIDLLKRVIGDEDGPLSMDAERKQDRS